MSQQPTEQWHMKKEVNLVHIISTIGLLVSSMWYLSGLDKRISANEQSIEHVQSQRTEDQKRVEKQLDKINGKLDRLLEKR
jgi:peptidoglycan hydrolase CwlO-like protein